MGQRSVRRSSAREERHVERLHSLASSRREAPQPGEREATRGRSVANGQFVANVRSREIARDRERAAPSRRVVAAVARRLLGGMKMGFFVGQRPIAAIAVALPILSVSAATSCSGGSEPLFVPERRCEEASRGASAFRVLCGPDLECSGSTPLCCVSKGDARSCVASESECPSSDEREGFGISVSECDETADCAPGMHCCSSYSKGTSSSSTFCTDDPSCRRHCASSCECAAGEECLRANEPVRSGERGTCGVKYCTCSSPDECARLCQPSPGVAK